ncbi:MAG: hypothetical protein FWB98_06645, partial [Defluviitaleaceae bacterium]|nr:hypothetical protein [Defluviitaleaceae bacterium]
RSAWYLFDGHVAGAALNIFFRNDSPDEIALTILVINDSVGELEYISQTIAPHSNFVRQIPSNLRVLDINIVTQGGILGGYIQGELAFRFTQGTIDQ